MNQFGLIIEETTAGSNLQFISSHLDRTIPEIKETLADERILATQLANLSDVYSVQITTNYKIYSLIVTNLTDFLGRSGYYAIRLYAPKNVNLSNFENILASIKAEYNNYTKSSTLNSQNYDAILSSILVLENDRKNFLSLKSNTNCFYYFDDNYSNLSTVFNTKGINLVHKVYAFNRNKAVPENVAQSTGLKPFESIIAVEKEINIINNYGILKDLKINEQAVNFNPNLSEFFLLCQLNDTVTYSTSDDKTIKVVSNTFVSIDRKIVPKPPVKQYAPQNGKKKESFIDVYGTSIIIGLMTVLIGAGGWFYYQEEYAPEPHYQEPNSNYNQIEDENSNSADASLIKFEKDSSNGEQTTYRTNYKGLEKYRFRLDNKKWTYKNTQGKDKYVEFYKTNLDEIIKTDNLEFNEDSKNKFFKNLKQIGNQEILDKKEIPVSTEKNNNSSAVKAKTATTPSGSKPKVEKGNSSPTKTKTPEDNNLGVGNGKT